jgi:hypothetical protein
VTDCAFVSEAVCVVVVGRGGERTGGLERDLAAWDGQRGWWSAGVCTANDLSWEFADTEGGIEPSRKYHALWRT